MIDPDRIFRLMEQFFDPNLTFGDIERIQREIEDEFDRQFVNTLRKTIELCHCIKEEEVPQTLHAQVIQSICQTPQECDEAFDCDDADNAGGATTKKLPNKSARKAKKPKPTRRKK